MKVVTNTSSAYEGTYSSLALTSGQTMTCSASVRGAVGGEFAQLAIGNSLAGQAYGSATLTTGWQRINATLTPTASSSGNTLAIRDAGAVAETFYVDALLCEQSSSVGSYFDGSSNPPATSWTGTTNDSTSVGPG